MSEFPVCTRCQRRARSAPGVLLPLSDFGRDASTLVYKAWVCSNEDCGFALVIDNGFPGYVTKVGSRIKQSPPEMKHE